MELMLCVPSGGGLCHRGRLCHPPIDFYYKNNILKVYFKSRILKNGSVLFKANMNILKVEWSLNMNNCGRSRVP